MDQKRVSDKEREAVSKLPPAERYRHFIKEVAAWEAVWTLGNEDGYVLAKAPEGEELVPVWPHAIYAELCAAGSWAKNRPERIGLDEWLQEWLGGLESDRRLIAVFPVEDSTGLIVSPATMREDLIEESEQYT